MIIDFHFHVTKDILPPVFGWMERLLDGEDPKAYLDRVLTKEAVTSLLRDNGVDYAVALGEQNPRVTGVISNDAVADFCRDVSCLIPFADVNPYIFTRPAHELSRVVREMGFKGVKLYPPYQLFYPHDPMIYPLYETAEELGIPVMVHTGSSIFSGVRLKYGNPMFMDDVAVDFPDLTIILVHGGRGFWYKEAFLLSRLHERVYVEIAGLPPQNLLHYFPDLEKNIDKIIFGSDWPGSIPKDNIKAIQQLPIAEDSKAKILGENAARILGLSPQEAKA